MIPDEPVRGQVPPEWIHSLDGLERMRLSAWGRLPRSPFARLTGVQFSNVAPGNISMIQPAVPSLQAGNGQLVITPLLGCGLWSACQTALPAGAVARAMSFTADAFRPARAQPGNMVCRARVVSATRIAVFAEASLEDPEGRSLVRGGMYCEIVPLEGDLPDPPSDFPRVEEPVYESPDPFLRTMPSPMRDLPWRTTGGRELIARCMEEDLNDPMFEILGMRFVEASDSKLTIEMPASRWFAHDANEVSPVVIASVLDMSAWCGASLAHAPGARLAAIDESMRFYGAAVPDGRPIRFEATVDEHNHGYVEARSRAYNADGELIGEVNALLKRLADGTDPSGPQRKTERVLASLLFCDIVSSTEQVSEVGDVAWNEKLERHYTALRREISRYNGIEVATAGDGFFARFETPGRALDAARAIRREASRLGLQVRSGIHTGECEIRGNTLTGIAVHLAARIEATARSGEVWVSSTVRELMGGSGVEFADEGEFDLKGIPEKRRLFSVVDDSAG